MTGKSWFPRLRPYLFLWTSCLLGMLACEWMVRPSPDVLPPAVQAQPEKQLLPEIAVNSALAVDGLSDQID